MLPVIQLHFIQFFQLVPAALTKAIADDVDFRRGLPRDYLTYLGVQNCDKVRFVLKLVL